MRSITVKFAAGMSVSAANAARDSVWGAVSLSPHARQTAWRGDELLVVLEQGTPRADVDHLAEAVWFVASLSPHMEWVIADGSPRRRRSRPVWEAA